MSEMGPISRRLRFLWRINSCPAAKGIICSICRPRATLEPSGTKSAMAWRRVRILDMAVFSINRLFLKSRSRVTGEGPLSPREISELYLRDTFEHTWVEHELTD